MNFCQTLSEKQEADIATPQLFAGDTVYSVRTEE